MIVRVVPDIPGLDKNFDYSVPPLLVPLARVGAVVRVELNRRRVDAWVVAVGRQDDPGFSDVPREKLVDILSVADMGVAPDVIPLAAWVAEHWSGPLRNVLKSATPERKMSRPRNVRRSDVTSPSGKVADVVSGLLSSTGGVLALSPRESALPVVEVAAARGTVLVLCPTQRMARLGAAWLRRRGLSTAELPGDVEAAASGVNVVIGARSAVFADCDGMASIVVVDEHEEAFHEERVPTWWAPAVAAERARRLGIPVIMTSAVPSAAATLLLGNAVPLGETSWPDVRVVDLGEVPVRGSLLSGELLEAVRNAQGAILCVLNTKGTGRLMVCKSCRALQVCAECGSSVSVRDEDLVCSRCGHERDAVCGDCGRTALVAARSGVTSVCNELQASTGLAVTEVTSATSDVGNGSGIWVGTDALLHRVSSAAAVFFLDIDRDLSAPRMGAGRDLLASVSRAARIVGSRGVLCVQTRQPAHPLVAAVASGRVHEWLDHDTDTARSLGLPPFSSSAVCTFSVDVEEATVPSVLGVDWSLAEKVLSVRCADHAALLAYLAGLKEVFGSDVRVAVNPPRQ